MSWPTLRSVGSGALVAKLQVEVVSNLLNAGERAWLLGEVVEGEGVELA